MGPLAIPLISGGLNLLGGLLGNKSAADQASAQRAWEQDMSSTSWQRGVADMRKAGINPMLAYMQGGASTPGGAMAGVPNPNVLGDAASSAMGMAVQQRQAKLLDNQAFTEHMRGFNELLESIKTQINDLPFMVGDPRSGQSTAPDAPGLTGVRWQLQNALTEATTSSAQAAAEYARAGVGQRQGVSDMFRMVSPLIHSAGEGFRRIGRFLPGGDQ